MSKIIELPEVLANQIAAGEVIERPASVVKELVENSIDAGSSQITIEIEESGLKNIQVTDNGEGISQEDVALSLHRHATSKIKSQADLFRIRTLGFRGEAIPSIASISHFTVKTATADEHYGTLLVAKGGEIERQEAISTPVGTKITVENLFYNTPARLKYMKSLQSELAHIVDVVNRLSLAHPEIAFTLINDGRQMTTTSGTGDLRQAIAGIYGLNTAKKMIEISNADLDFEVSGYISLPELTRANRNYITILINGRYIKNFLLNRAILDGYGSKLMVGRFPIAVIDIQIDPYLADVNVHPTKQEVRISKEKELMGLISSAIAESLREQDLIPDALENLAKSSTRGFSKPQQTSLPLKQTNLYYDKERHDFFVKSDTVEEEPAQLFNEVDKAVKQVDKQSSVRDAQRSLAGQAYDEHDDLDFKNKTKINRMIESLDKEEVSTFPELEYFGQMHGTYLFAQGNGGLYIIDQHAAQERVKYEYYRDKIGEVDDSLQQLLMPYLFEFSGADFIKIQEKMELLKQVGINLEPYGNNTFILREHPIWMKEEEIETAVYEMCDMLLLTNEVSVKKYRAELAIMMSCKRSIKANHTLDDYSARQLIVQLSQCKNPYNCPHGRPVLVNFTKSDMEKMFRRIQENHTSLRELGKY
ncbi:DNA mismatch repair protein mutL [Streptococcus infantarius subsp. infantarius]|nr:DNA mismatch repair protein mutL [Streptococcus infantarius subsp. infantarius CJ18]MCO4647643.1 DNA mismatch repair protein mutL [Streptococcus infantarius subsp. infantarius]MCO4655878.1 DNA mismatch repair protein mutL [Streptococcus infantarius subsp. infantarius]MCO4656845.1 DNA mismatch repair protein mutL [Streptococcus infantarius subsp. infantarius]MCO4659660.1 DNA mismatch repair protein mutL [Streptococcus infantarius subsp. infantarius]